MNTIIFDQRNTKMDENNNDGRGNDNTRNNYSNSTAIGQQHWNMNYHLPDSSSSTGQQLLVEEDLVASGRGMNIHVGSTTMSNNNNINPNNYGNDERRQKIYYSTANDVLFGRGRPLQNHPGNLRFHKIVNRNRDFYMNSRKEDKISVARKVMNEIKSTVSTAGDSDTAGGRFLKKFDNNGCRGGEDFWVEVSIQASIEKISHALRGRPRSENRNCVGRETKSGSSSSSSSKRRRSNQSSSSSSSTIGGKQAWGNGISNTRTTLMNGEDNSNSDAGSRPLQRKWPPSSPIQESTVECIDGDGTIMDAITSTGSLFSNNNNTNVMANNNTTPSSISSSQVQVPIPGSDTLVDQQMNFINQQLQLQAIQRQNQLVQLQQQQVLQQLGGQHPLLNQPNQQQQQQQQMGPQSIQSQPQNGLYQHQPQPQQPPSQVQQLLALQQGNQPPPQQVVDQDLQLRLMALLTYQQQQNQNQNQNQQGQQEGQLHQLQQQQLQQQQLLSYQQLLPLSTVASNNAPPPPIITGDINANIATAAVAATNSSAINDATSNPDTGGDTNLSTIKEALILAAAAILSSQQQQQQQSQNPPNLQIAQGQQHQQQQQQQLSQTLLLAALMQGKQQHQQQPLVQNLPLLPPPPPPPPTL